MDIKVGDIVEYKGEIMRLMSIYPYKLRMSHIGMIFGDISELRLIESVELPNIDIGDLVIVHDIPSEEKSKYTFSWGPNRESYVKFGQPYQVLNVAIDENYGTCINLNGMWFVPYHLEKVNHYDMI